MLTDILYGSLVIVMASLFQCSKGTSLV